MNTRRARLLKQGHHGEGPVLYWMHRDHRVRDNWALNFASLLSLQAEVPLLVVHCLDLAYPLARAEHFRFLIEGLDAVREVLKGLGIPFVQLLGDPPIQVENLTRTLDASAVVSDFDPLRHKRHWLARLCESAACPVHEVDARNVVPCFVASDKAEYMARTLRPKIHRLLPEFLDDFPEPPKQSCPSGANPDGLTRDQLERAIPQLKTSPPPRFFKPGETAAQAALVRFATSGLHGYATRRNDPSSEGQSGLSPWLHFGMLSAQRVALTVAASKAPAEDKEALLEELIVRRELADNFCLYHPDYDSTSCYPDWAKRTLEKHARDPRPYLYSKPELETGQTHDPAWNAAQLEMTATGKMHGYMRMYWGKKLLEWTSSADEAQEIAVDLNDRYELDGRDPNGYAGIAWSIGGVHDRPWAERPVFGQVRYMNFQGLRRKFDVEAYIAKVDMLAGK
jgi:deoxyribodipyrimidine photo-lyase